MINKKLLLLLIVSALMFTANIGGFSIYVLDEAKNSTCALSTKCLDRINLHLM